MKVCMRIIRGSNRPNKSLLNTGLNVAYAAIFYDIGQYKSK